MPDLIYFRLFIKNDIGIFNWDSVSASLPHHPILMYSSTIFSTIGLDFHKEFLYGVHQLRYLYSPWKIIQCSWRPATWCLKPLRHHIFMWGPRLSVWTTYGYVVEERPGALNNLPLLFWVLGSCSTSYLLLWGISILLKWGVSKDLGKWGRWA